jgi:hypothetical protein
VSGGPRYDGPSAESNRNIGLPRFPVSLLIEDGPLTGPLYLIVLPVPVGHDRAHRAAFGVRPAMRSLVNALRAISQP